VFINFILSRGIDISRPSLNGQDIIVSKAQVFQEKRSRDMPGDWKLTDMIYIDMEYRTVMVKIGMRICWLEWLADWSR